LGFEKDRGMLKDRRGEVRDEYRWEDFGAVWDAELPGRMGDPDTPRTMPYTEEELDMLVEGVLDGISDTEAWKQTVEKLGYEGALEALRAGIRAKGPSVLDRPPSMN
jgi:hypothetical protein